MDQKFVILGAGGFAREVLDVFEACREAGQDCDVLGFVVDSKCGQIGTIVNDKPILGDFLWLAGRAGESLVVCGVADPAVRRRMVLRAQQAGVRFGSVVHPTAVLTPRVSIGEGVVITAGCILTNRIRIGHHVHVNLDCTIGHDTVLEDFVTLSPGVHVSGNVVLKEGCFVGTGASIIEKRTLGPWSVVGAGCVVTGDVPANATVVGVPGKVIKNREAGWHL